MTDTIVALSSGAVPAGIAVMRLSGPAAFAAARAICGALPEPRRAALRRLRDRDGETLDQAIVLTFPGPASFTGEDIVELHVHGGRAVVRAVEAALLETDGVRVAEPGEFTRRALIAGRLDLTEAEGLGDLLAAETDAQRRAAQRMAEGGLRARIADWSRRTVALSAMVEAVIEFEEDEVDVANGGDILDRVRADASDMASEIEDLLRAPPAERLRDGIRVVLAGPPNSGKSTLFNALVGRDAAIVSPIVGTTRDRIEAPVLRHGVAWLLIDTAGLADHTADAIEAIGIERSYESIACADVILWLGDGPCDHGDALLIHARRDEPGRAVCPPHRLPVAAGVAADVDRLWRALAALDVVQRAQVDGLMLNQRQRTLCRTAQRSLCSAVQVDDVLLIAEDLRTAARTYDLLTGAADVEAVLDALFAGFCIGK